MPSAGSVCDTDLRLVDLKVVLSLKTSVVMGTLFPTRVPANLLPAGTRVPVYWIEDVLSFKMNPRLSNSDH